MFSDRMEGIQLYGSGACTWHRVAVTRKLAVLLHRIWVRQDP